MMLKIDNFSNYILKNISLCVKEDLIILGSNGAGKSTLAKVICGLIESLHVEIFSQKLDKLSPKQRAKTVNYIPPKLEVFDPYIDVEEYLQLSGTSVDEILKLLNIETLKNKSCQSLSSGEQQLTLFASAILQNAKLTVFDEPTANLDPKKTLQIFKLLQKFQNKIIITHDFNLAYKLNYNIAFMENGKIEFLGTSKEFFSDTNIKKFFKNSIKKVDNCLVINL